MTIPRFTRHELCRVAVSALVLACGLGFAFDAVRAQPGLPPAPMPDAAPAPGDDEVEVLTRGPVHEAFAEQFNADAKPGLIVPKAPPADIEELIPDTVPEGDNMQWVHGYWAWDDEIEDFIWVSGFWRDYPVGQRWVPGYWHEVPGGYQWVSGFWMTEQNEELAYLPEPPASLDVGPSTSAPTESHFWVPGCWYYVGGGYRWRAGFWSPCYDEWVWVPDRYVWTPFGFVFRPGYHDRRLPDRGCLFAPVRFAHVHYWHRPRVFYTPSFVIDTGPLALHLFVRPTYCHYYFGDFYAAQYTGWGFRPWYTCDFRYRSTYCYDPLLVFYAGYHRRHGRIDYCDRLASWNRYYRDHEHHRPPRNARDLDRFVAQHGRDDRHREVVKNVSLGRKLDDVVKEPRGERQFRRITEQERTEKVKVSRDARELVKFRKEAEGGDQLSRRQPRSQPGQIPAVNGVVAEQGDSGREGKTRKVKLPKAVSGTSGQAVQPRTTLPTKPGGGDSGRVTDNRRGSESGGSGSGRNSRRTVTAPGADSAQTGDSTPGLPGTVRPRGSSNSPGDNKNDRSKPDKPDNGVERNRGPSRTPSAPTVVPRSSGSPAQGNGDATKPRGSSGGSERERESRNNPQGGNLDRQPRGGSSGQSGSSNPGAGSGAPRRGGESGNSGNSGGANGGGKGKSDDKPPRSETRRGGSASAGGNNSSFGTVNSNSGNRPSSAGVRSNRSSAAAPTRSSPAPRSADRSFSSRAPAEQQSASRGSSRGNSASGSSGSSSRSSRSSSGNSAASRGNSGGGSEDRGARKKKDR
jgi:hypothetical protein